MQISRTSNAGKHIRICAHKSRTDRFCCLAHLMKLLPWGRFPHAHTRLILWPALTCCGECWLPGLSGQVRCQASAQNWEACVCRTEPGRSPSTLFLNTLRLQGTALSAAGPAAMENVDAMRKTRKREVWRCYFVFWGF